MNDITFDLLFEKKLENLLFQILSVK